MDIHDVVDEVPLVDHHCHSISKMRIDELGFETLASESSWPAPFGGSHLDTPFGIAMRAICPELLGLPRHAPPDVYQSGRSDLGPDHVNRTLLGSTGIGNYIVETGTGGRVDFLTPAELARAGGGTHAEVLRLETTAEKILRGLDRPDEFRDAFEAELDNCADVVGYKTIAGYRTGLDFDPSRPTKDELDSAVSGELRTRDSGQEIRLENAAIVRHVIWAAVERRKPIQVHVGFGDSDIDMYRNDPSLMTEFIRRTVDSGCAITLLHCYPFHRQASFLAHVYPHVYVDSGAALNFTGASAHRILAESLELAPFQKVLFSTDAFGLAELFACGARLWRDAVKMVFTDWVTRDAMSLVDATRYINAMAHETAKRIYEL